MLCRLVLTLFHDFHALLLYIMTLIRVTHFHLSSSGRKGSDLARALPQFKFCFPCSVLLSFFGHCAHQEIHQIFQCLIERSMSY